MLNNNILKEARKILLKDKIELKGSGNDRLFFDVASVSVIVSNSNYGYRFDCCCKHCSIHSVNGPFCSYQLAVIGYLINKKTIL